MSLCSMFDVPVHRVFVFVTPAPLLCVLLDGLPILVLLELA